MSPELSTPIAIPELNRGWATKPQRHRHAVDAPVCDDVHGPDYNYFWCSGDEDLVLETGRSFIVQYWGFSSGGLFALAFAETMLRSIDLSQEQIGKLRVSLPLYGDGTTAQKVERIDRVLKRLEFEAKEA